MLQLIYGEIAEAEADVIVNAANGSGWMGGKRCRKELHRGVAEHLNFFSHSAIEKEALKAARKYPHIISGICGTQAGGFFTTGSGGLACREVVHAVTMRRPGHKSSLESIREVLPKIFRHCTDAGFRSVAIPYLGCGTGGLNKKEVYELILQESEKYPELEVRLYDFASEKNA